MTAIFTLPRQQPVAGDVSLSSGQFALRAYPAARLEFYRANTLEPIDVYSNSSRSTAHAWPVTADSSGKFPVIYLPAGITMDVILKTSTGATIDTYEDVPGDDLAASGSVSGVGREMPVGAIVYHSLPEVPDGWLRIKRDPQALLKSGYPELNAKYSALGYPYGSTSTTFNIPGGAGLFARIWDNTSTHDPDSAGRLTHATGIGTVGNIIGSRQASQNITHTHGVGTLVNATTGDHTHFVVSSGASTSPISSGNYAGNAANYGGGNSFDYLIRGAAAIADQGISSNAGNHTHDLTGATAQSGGTESRPSNVAFPFIIFVSPQSAAANHSTLGLPYKFSNATADADPGGGFIALNNATMGNATQAYISKTDAFASDVGDLWGEINNVTGSRRAVLTIYSTGAMANSISAIVSGALVDQGTYWRVPIANRSSNGALIQNGFLSVQFALSGPGAGLLALASFTVAELAAINVGPNLAIATNGRKNGEGVGVGTGVMAFRVGSTWFACDTGATLAA